MGQVVECLCNPESFRDSERRFLSPSIVFKRLVRCGVGAGLSGRSLGEDRGGEFSITKSQGKTEYLFIRSILPMENSVKDSSE